MSVLIQFHQFIFETPHVRVSLHFVIVISLTGCQKECQLKNSSFKAYSLGLRCITMKEVTSKIWKKRKHNLMKATRHKQIKPAVGVRVTVAFYDFHANCLNNCMLLPNELFN